jgi:hypothetical protein
MVSYSSWNGVKMHANSFLITDFLKTKLRFRVSTCNSFFQGRNDSIISTIPKYIEEPH